MSRSTEEVLVDEVKPQLVDLARVRAPEEACGLLEWDGSQLHVHPLLNVAEDPPTSFLCDPYEQGKLLQAIFDRGTELWAIWHSHPSQGPEPSKTDRHFAERIGSLTWVIVGLEPLGVWVGRP